MDAKAPSNQRVTIAAVNAALLSEFGPGIELVKGRGYFYFAGPQTDHFETQGIYVNRLGVQTVAEWVTDARNMKAKADADA